MNPIFQQSKSPYAAIESGVRACPNQREILLSRWGVYLRLPMIPSYTSIHPPLAKIQIMPQTMRNRHCCKILRIQISLWRSIRETAGLVCHSELLRNPTQSHNGYVKRCSWKRAVPYKIVPKSQNLPLRRMRHPRVESCQHPRVVLVLHTRPRHSP